MSLVVYCDIYHDFISFGNRYDKIKLILTIGEIYMAKNPRKQIIINEILFWKQNKLLPEHYCDFLMTLYTEGENVHFDHKISHKKSLMAKEKRKNFIYSFFLLLLVIILLFSLIYMAKFIWIVSLFIGIVSILFMISSFIFSRKNFILSAVLQVGAALLILGLSVKVSVSYFPENQLLLYILLIANCAMWIISGIKLKLVYFTISGVLCVIAIISFILFFS